MEIEFVKKEKSNTRLILVYAGWGAGPLIAAGIDRQGWDLAVVHDFSELSLDTSFLDGYYTVYLFAWSLGVYAASLTLPADRITAAIAINGTLTPVDDNEGIPETIYTGTAETLDARNLRKFRMRMISCKDDAAIMVQRLDDDFSDSKIKNLTSQLRNIYSASKAKAPASDLPWIRAYVSEGDRIFPAGNQKMSWGKCRDVQVVPLETGHFVPLEDAVDSILSDFNTVARKFSRATSTYDTQAIAQYSAAIKLADAFAAMNPPNHGKILEIGCGTGLFTREYSRRCSFSEATFVDITQTGPFGIAQAEKYVVEDAEKWIEQQPSNNWDSIVSASAIQWFSDIPRFLSECRRCLKHGGILAISTFAPGNLGELDILRPSPIVYPKPNTISKNLEGLFTEFTVTEDCINVQFKSIREMLIHLKHTGVGGSGSGTGKTLSEMANLRNLTYRPLYILARKD